MATLTRRGFWGALLAPFVLLAGVRPVRAWTRTIRCHGTAEWTPHQFIGTPGGPEEWLARWRVIPFHIRDVDGTRIVTVKLDALVHDWPVTYSTPDGRIGACAASTFARILPSLPRGTTLTHLAADGSHRWYA